jgi:hypothetical protein
MKPQMSNPSRLLIMPKFITAFVFMIPMLAFAQPRWVDNASQSDRMQALRIAYFVEELSLTSEESALFWPAWNEEQDKLRAHGDAIRAVETKLKEVESDAEAEQLINELKELQLKAVELQHQVVERMSGFIGYRRAGMIKQVERAFRTQVMKRRMNGNGNGQGQRPGGQRPGSPQRH